MANQVMVRDLHQEIQAGRIRLASAVGKGNSSGPSVDGILANNTAEEINIDIHLRTPIYLANSGRSQNMIAAQVFLEGLRYVSDGIRSFITLKARDRVPVTFLAYCVDFEKDNPSATDNFTAAPVPERLTQVMANIADYLVENPEADITVAAQLAVWLAQGEPIQSIRERFAFEPGDERLARALTQH